MPTAPKSRTRQKRQADRRSSTERGYNYRWQLYRRRFLIDHPLCCRCSTTKRPVAATQVDHIIPVESADDPGFWAAANHQPLCESCHSTKTNTEDTGRGRKPVRT